MARVIDTIASKLPETVRRPLRPLYAAVAGQRTPSLDDAAYEPEVRGALERIVQPGWVCADVGAHHGILTATLARLVGEDGRVIAFEAHPDNVALLRKAFGADERGSWVTIENLAVTDGGADSVWLHAGRGRHSTEWNVGGTDLDGNPTPAEVEVPATSLDRYFEPGARLDFVKIDVEGAEGDVLAGMQRLLRETRPVLAIEFHHDAAWEGRRHLFDAGYDLQTLDGTRLDPERDTTRVYQCLAVPR